MKDANGKYIGLGPGDDDTEVYDLKAFLVRKFQWVRDWNPRLNIDKSYDATLEDIVKELQRRYGLPVTGIANYATKVKCGFVKVQSPPQPAYRPIWIYTAPGSGADWWVGPSFELGEWCKNVLHLNHQPLGFPKGGYLGLMGGDPTFSYNDVIGFEGAELEQQLGLNPDVQKAMTARRADPNASVDVELWFSGYSQSADGMEDAVQRLFGDGGPYALIRDRINGLVQFGNPSKRDTGIARKVRPEWLYALVHNLNHPNDFYAEAPDAIRPPFYKIIVEADTELPFGVHVLKVAMRVLGNFIPGLAAILGPVASLMSMVGSPDEPVDDELVNLLSVQGVLTHLPDLFNLLGALPGIAAHGDWGPLMPAAIDVVASFHR